MANCSFDDDYEEHIKHCVDCRLDRLEERLDQVAAMLMDVASLTAPRLIDRLEYDLIQEEKQLPDLQ